MDLVTLVYLLFFLIIGFFIGWISSPFNKAKLFRMIGKHKKVLFIVNSKGRARDFLVDHSVSDNAIKVVVKPLLGKIVQEFTVFPNSNFDGDWNTIPFAFFDGKDSRQIPLSAYTIYLGEQEVQDKNGNVVTQQVWKPNFDLLGNLVSPTKIQNILSTQSSSERLKARNETNQDNKSMLSLVKICVGASVIALLIICYVALQQNSALNLIGGIAAQTAKAATIGNFTAS